MKFRDRMVFEYCSSIDRLRSSTKAIGIPSKTKRCAERDRRTLHSLCPVARRFEVEVRREHSKCESILTAKLLRVAVESQSRMSQQAQTSQDRIKIQQQFPAPTCFERRRGIWALAG